jgi:hypothetical protein
VDRNEENIDRVLTELLQMQENFSQDMNDASIKIDKIYKDATNTVQENEDKNKAESALENFIY